MSNLPAEFWYFLAACALGVAVAGFVGGLVSSFCATRKRRATPPADPK